MTKMTNMNRRDLLKLMGTGAGAAALYGATGGFAAAASQTTLDVWDYYGPPDSIYGRPLQELYNHFMQANPNVKVDKRFVTFSQFNRLLLMSAAGGGMPDVALTNAFDTAKFAKAGVARDITARVQEWGLADKYFDSSWATTMWNGKNYALPHVVDCYVLWYNKDHLAAAGYQQPPQTWEELGSMAQKLSKGDRTGFAFSAVEGIQGATAWVIRFLAAGGDITQVDSEAGRTALQQWVDLVESGASSPSVLEWIEADVYNRFKAGNASMMLQSGSYVSVLKEEAPDLNWGVALLPKDKKRASFLSSEDLIIGSGSNSVDAAWDLITYMQQPEVLKRYLPERNKLPARKDVAQDPFWTEDPIWSVFLEQLPTAWAPQGEVALNSSEILTYIQESIQLAISGTASVSKALDRAQQKIDGALAS